MFPANLVDEHHNLFENAPQDMQPLEDLYIRSLRSLGSHNDKMANFSTTSLLKKVDAFLDVFPQKIVRYTTMDYLSRHSIYSDVISLCNELSRREDKYRGQPELALELGNAVNRLNQALEAMDHVDIALMKAEAIPPM